MPLDPTSIIPSGKYIAILDNNGVAKILQRPNNKCLLGFDGDDAYWMDGTDAFPLILPNMAENTGEMTHIVGMLSSGRQFKFVGTNDKKRYLSSEAGVVKWDELLVVGFPATGNGLSYRPAYVQDGVTPVPPAALLNTTGLVYIGSDGNAVSITNGANGQQLTVINGVPSWTPPPSGTVTDGGTAVGMSGISASNTSASVVNIKCPQLTLSDNAGNHVTASNVNVSVDLTASLGPGGLDLGAEASNQWYYVYVIADASNNVRAIASTNGAAPNATNMGAYVYYFLASVFRNDGSGNIINFIQRGRSFWTRLQVWTDPAAITTSYNAIPSGTPLAALIPPNAKTVSGISGGSQGAGEAANVGTWVAADNNGLGEQFIPYSPSLAPMEGFRTNYGGFYDMPIADPTAPTLYWKGYIASTKRRVAITNYSI